MVSVVWFLYQLLTDEVPQDQSGTNEQGIKFGNLVAADEKNNQRKLVAENDGSRMPSNSKIGSAEDSVQIVRYIHACLCAN